MGFDRLNRIRNRHLDLQTYFNNKKAEENNTF